MSPILQQPHEDVVIFKCPFCGSMKVIRDTAPQTVIQEWFPDVSPCDPAMSVPCPVCTCLFMRHAPPPQRARRLFTCSFSAN